MDQMERNQTYGKHFEDLLNDYMSLYEIKNMLIKDIEKRGVTVEYNNGGGQKGIKKNDSIEQLLNEHTDAKDFRCIRNQSRPGNGW